jgi:hypothetical protein
LAGENDQAKRVPCRSQATKELMMNIHHSIDAPKFLGIYKSRCFDFKHALFCFNGGFKTLFVGKLKL